MCDTFLPSMRRRVTLRLRGQGYSQGKIASMLGVTQASVSLYLKPDGPVDPLQALGVSPEDADLYASLLAEDLKKNPVYALSTLYSLWSDILGRGAMCSAHRSLYPELLQCDVCIKTFGSRETRAGDAIEHVADAVGMVERSSEFVSIMPEVSVNIAFAPEGATSAQQIVAIPGRIVRVGGRARSFMRPEYGASTHVANVLLTIMSRDRSIRACMNVRYDQRMRRALRRTKVHALLLEEADVKTDAHMISSLRDALKNADGPIEAVIDFGAPGLEPATYLFGHDAVEVVRLGMRVARAYFTDR